MDSKPTLKGEIDEHLQLSFGDVQLKTNIFGNIEIHIYVNETHTVKYYRMDQRKNNTLHHLELVIKLNEDK